MNGYKWIARDKWKTLKYRREFGCREWIRNAKYIYICMVLFHSHSFKEENWTTTPEFWDENQKDGEKMIGINLWLIFGIRVSYGSKCSNQI